MVTVPRSMAPTPAIRRPLGAAYHLIRPEAPLKAPGNKPEAPLKAPGNKQDSLNSRNVA